MIPLAYLNDFAFCPYSIYLHGIFYGVDDDLYKAKPQMKGTQMHCTVDEGLLGNKSTVTALPVCSETYGLYGIIDIFDTADGILTERKSHCTSVFPGQKYQLWGQYVCLLEMGYKVNYLQVQDMNSGRVFPVKTPNDKDIEDFMEYVNSITDWNPTDCFPVNRLKCRHCIYCNLCDKTDEENVYEKGY